MLVYETGELTPLAIGLIGGFIMFLGQLALCTLVKNKFIKLFPVYLIVLSFIFGGAVYMGLFGEFPLGSLSGNEVLGGVYIFTALVTSLGVAFAWLTYGIKNIIKK